MNSLKKIMSFGLALLVLMSTLSFTVEQHFCGDYLVDVSFTGNLKSCGSEMSIDGIKKMKKCCKDEVIQFEGQDELKHQDISFDFKKQQFLVAFAFTDQFSNDFYNASVVDTLIDIPPDILVDYQVSYQTFLL